MRRALVGILVAAGALLLSTPAFASDSIKLSAPSAVNYGSGFTFTVSGHGTRPTSGAKRSYPPNLVTVSALTSPTARCPSRLGRISTDLESVLRFHSKKVSQVLKSFSRTKTVTPPRQAYGLCAYLLNFPSGVLYAHAAAYWKVNGGPTHQLMYTLTVSVDNSAAPGVVTSNDANIDCGNAEVRCSHAYAPGTTVELIEEANPMLAIFGGWGGECSGTDVSCNVTMDSNKTVTAAFMPAQ